MTEGDNDDAANLLARAWALRREGSVDAARDGILAAVMMFRNAGDMPRLVDALGKLGHVHMDEQQWDEAEDVYHEAVQIAQDSGDLVGEAHKTRHLGDLYRLSGRSTDALAFYRSAIDLYRGIRRRQDLDVANALRGFALAAEESGDGPLATELWQEAHDLYAQLGLQEGVDECRTHLKR